MYSVIILSGLLKPYNHHCSRTQVYMRWKRHNRHYVTCPPSSGTFGWLRESSSSSPSSTSISNSNTSPHYSFGPYQIAHDEKKNLNLRRPSIPNIRALPSSRLVKQRENCTWVSFRILGGGSKNGARNKTVSTVIGSE